MGATLASTSAGTVEGFTDARGLHQFLGIPYAAPPVGDLRWRPPAATPAWTGTRDATRHGNRALQVPYPEVLDFGDVPGAESEDCLYLNVVTPAVDSARRPVLVWIHGGGYIMGSANEYDGSAVADANDVVVVSINYRLGIFGFFDLTRFGPDWDGSAQLGIQDQIAALAWVRDNIAGFGGDPDNVTIWGESAGAGSVLALLAAPAAEGLFHRAMAFSPGEPMGPPADNLAAVAAYLDADIDDTFEKLRSMDARELHEVQLSSGFSGGAAIDGHVVTQAPPAAIRARGADGVPLITGNTRDEGTYLADSFDGIPGGYDTGVALFAGTIGNGEPRRYLDYLQTILGDADPRARMEQTWLDLFRASALRSAEASSDAGPGGWVYSFEAPTEHPLGVTHASEIAFTFNAFASGSPTFTVHDAANPAIRDLASHWSATLARFARTGDPNGAGLPYWPTYEPARRSCLIVDTPSYIETDPDGALARAAFGMNP